MRQRFPHVFAYMFMHRVKDITIFLTEVFRKTYNNKKVIIKYYF